MSKDNLTIKICPKCGHNNKLNGLFDKICTGCGYHKQSKKSKEQRG